jgi:hypothetical protein
VGIYHAIASDPQPAMFRYDRGALRTFRADGASGCRYRGRCEQKQAQRWNEVRYQFLSPVFFLAITS